MKRDGNRILFDSVEQQSRFENLLVANKEHVIRKISQALVEAVVEEFVKNEAGLARFWNEVRTHCQKDEQAVYNWPGQELRIVKLSGDREMVVENE
jgi:hypothetical protein